MIDIQYLRDNAELVKQKSAEKGYPVDIDQLLGFDTERRELLGKVEDLRRQRNELAGQTQGQRPSDEQIAKGRELKDQLADLEHQLASIEKEFETLFKQVPNMPWDDVPVGHSEDENQEVGKWGEPPHFDFEAKNHWEIAEQKGWIDKERAARTAGSRFAYIKGDLVKLQLALISFTVDVLTDENRLREIIEYNNLRVGDHPLSAKPFTPVLPPLMVRTEVYDAMDRLEPSDDRYKLEGEDLWLQGSAEHVLGPLHMGEIISVDQLPIRYLGYATSFRREAGTYGKDMEGIIRMHQFDKLEMESFSLPDQSFQEHLFFVAIQEHLMQSLGLPYRKLQKCTFDIGKPNARGVDLEAWLPGQGKYRETHTADYMTDYQARRLGTKARHHDGATILVHTNDATAFAMGRAMVAIMENYQTAEGNVRVPDALRQYMGGEEQL